MHVVGRSRLVAATMAFHDLSRSRHTLIDAQLKVAPNPTAWCSPSLDELSSVAAGDLAKVGLVFDGGGERFWTIVRQVDDGTIRAEVNNVLLTCFDSPQCGYVIEFKKNHIIDWIPQALAAKLAQAA